MPNSLTLGIPGLFVYEHLSSTIKCGSYREHTNVNSLLLLVHVAIVWMGMMECVHGKLNDWTWAKTHTHTHIENAHVATLFRHEMWSMNASKTNVFLSTHISHLPIYIYAAANLSFSFQFLLYFPLLGFYHAWFINV